MTVPVESEHSQAIEQVQGELATVKGQLTDLPEIKLKLANLRLDTRADLRGISAQLADLPGMKARLISIEEKLDTILSLLQPSQS